MSFTALGVLPPLESVLVDQQITEPTPVQRISIPALLGRASSIVVARTGSGKTLAYGVPLMQVIRQIEDDSGPVTTPGRPRAIILTGTRELVEQTLRALKTLCHAARLRVRAIAGGMLESKMKAQISAPFDVLVANPPRLIKAVEAGFIQLDDVQMLVVDEADTLLSPSQRPDVVRLLDALKGRAAVSFFSATLPEPIRHFLLHRPEKPTLLMSPDAHAAPKTLQVRTLPVKHHERNDALHDLLGELPASQRGIVFTNRRETAASLAAWLGERGHTAVEVHGGRLPDERRKAMAAFKAGEGRVLITTELSGRGIHIDGLSFVFNYELPEKASEYLHRIGRVGRMGAGGLVVNLSTDADRALLAEIARLAKGGRLDTGEALRAERERPAPEVVAARKEARKHKRPSASTGNARDDARAVKKRNEGDNPRGGPNKRPVQGGRGRRG